MKNSQEGLIRRLELVKERISKHEERSIEIIVRDREKK